jgi:hypothetical protein
VEADGVLLTDLHQLVEAVTVRAGDGRAEVTVRHGADTDPATGRTP